jgi:hypothetical protein
MYNLDGNWNKQQSSLYHRSERLSHRTPKNTADRPAKAMAE